MSFHFQNVLSFPKCFSIFKICFHFQNVPSFLECAFIFEMCFHFQVNMSINVSAQMAALSTIFQVFIVLWVYNFVGAFLVDTERKEDLRRKKRFLAAFVPVVLWVTMIMKFHEDVTLKHNIFTASKMDHQLLLQKVCEIISVMKTNTLYVSIELAFWFSFCLEDHFSRKV